MSAHSGSETGGISHPCPECNDELERLLVDGRLYGYICEDCLIAWSGVTGLEIRWEHPETEVMGPGSPEVAANRGEDQ